MHKGHVILAPGNALHDTTKGMDDLFFPLGENKKIVYAIKDIPGCKVGIDKYRVPYVLRKKDTSKGLLKKVDEGGTLYDPRSVNSLGYEMVLGLLRFPNAHTLQKTGALSIPVQMAGQGVRPIFHG